MLGVLYHLKMKGMLVGVIFHSSVFCPPRSINSPVPRKTAVLVSVAASRSKGDAKLFCNYSESFCKLKYVHAHSPPSPGKERVYRDHSASPLTVPVEPALRKVEGPVHHSTKQAGSWLTVTTAP